MELLILQTESWSTFSNNPAHLVLDTTARIMGVHCQTILPMELLMLQTEYWRTQTILPMELLILQTESWRTQTILHMELLILQTESWSTFSNNPTHGVVDTIIQILQEL